MRRLKRTNWPLSIFFLLIAAAWINRDLFPAEGWALGTADMRALFYPWSEFVRNSLFQSQIPFWDTRHFGGTPFLHNPQIAFFYPPNWIIFGLPINRGISFFYLVHLWVAGWGMALFTRELLVTDGDSQPKLFGVGLGPLAAGVAFMLGGFFATRIHAGHIGFLATHSWLPWLLLATGRGLSQKRWSAISGISLFWALAILAGHTTTLLYLGMIWLLFVIWFTYTDIAKNWRFSAGLSSVALGLGLLISSVQLWPTIQLILRSGRVDQGGYEFATRFSLPWQQLMTLVVAEWFGEPANLGYWGAENFDELSSYAGIFSLIACGFVVYALVQRIDSRWPLFFLGLSVLGILIAVGENGFLYRILYVAFPPFRVMRAPGRALFFFAFSGPVLLGWLVQDLFNRPFYAKRILPKATAITAVAWLLLLAAVGASWWFATDPDLLNRRWHQLQSATITGVFALVGLVLLRWLVANQNRTGWVRLGSLLFLAVIATDLGMFGQKLIRPTPMTPYWVWFDAANAPETASGRILPWGFNIFEQNGSGQLGLESVFGYNTLENGAVTQLAASQTDPRAKAFDILNATYVVSEGGLGKFTDSETGLAGLIRQDIYPNIRVYPRPNALPYARLVANFEVIPDQEAQYARINEPEFNPADTVLFATSPNCTLPSNQADPLGEVAVTNRVGGSIDLTVSTQESAILVISEAAFPGWQAEVNGNRVEIETAYTAIQAICIPAGTHEVAMRFRPLIFLWGGVGTLLGLLIAFWLRKK